MPFRGDIRSVPVPGCVDGWLALHERYGRLPLSAVIAPAVSYAREGFPVSPTLAGAAPRVAGVRHAGPFDPSEPLRPGTRLFRPGVAAALESSVAHGRDGFYGGPFGRGLIELGAGEFDESDLARSQAQWCEPVGLDVPALGGRLWTTPPPTQGYLTLAAAWLAAAVGLPPDPDSPAWAHLLVEASRQAAFDRPDVLHESADGQALVDPARLEGRRRAIDPDHRADVTGNYASGGTIGLCAVDADRMGVSLLQSNASGFGVHIVEPATGIFLHNRGIGFNLVPGHPAEYGPGRRPPHTLSPLVVTGPDDGLRAVMASMGGDSQPQILLQLVARVFGAGQGAGGALAAGRFTLSGADDVPGSDGFATWSSGGRVVVELEGHAPAGWADGLQGRGHSVRRSNDRWGASFGHAHVITVEGDHLAGATDPRPRAGAAVGY